MGSVPRVSASRLGVVLAVLALFVLVPSAAVASTDFTWAETLANGDALWSDGADWVGGVAPSGSAASLVFPSLPDAGCAGWGNYECYTATDDLGNFSTGEISIDDGTGYVFDSSSALLELGLGSGGIAATTSSSVFAAPVLNLPIVLSAPQTWSINGGPAGRGGLGVENVTGDEPLGVDVSNGGILWVGLGSGGPENIAVGDVAITGANPTDTGADAYLNGAVAVHGDTLNASSGNPIDLVDAGLFGSGSVGSVSSTGGVITAGFPLNALFANGGVDPLGTLTVEGSITLDAASSLQVQIAGAGGTAGTAYSQLDATGDIALGDSELNITGSNANGSCPQVTPGTVDTLITTSTALNGTFANAANGATIPLDCDWPTPPTVTINYTSSSVTATIASQGVAPVISGSGGGGSGSGNAGPPATLQPAPLAESLATPGLLDRHGEQTVTIANPNAYPIAVKLQESGAIAISKHARAKPKTEYSRATVASSSR
jgi:hypothetical protein